MRNQNFGVEVEFTGITRAMSARILADYFGSTVLHIGGTYDTYTVSDRQNRNWKILNDASIISERKIGDEGSSYYRVELVTPICQYSDIEDLQEIIRKLREGGAKVNSSCGIHVHVCAAAHNPRTLRNIVNIIASKEELLYKTLKIKVDRERYCKKTDTRFLDELNRVKPKRMSDFENIWYNGRNARHLHYDESRYRALNLHSVFSKGTVEFRLFNSTLHAGEVKSYVQLCLAISHQALSQKFASSIKTVTDNEKYTFRTWLLKLGLIGYEFKTARMHLLKNLEGNIAWKDPAQAERQKQRLAEKRLMKTQEVEPAADAEAPENTQRVRTPDFEMSM